jgi:hypothetical protein
VAQNKIINLKNYIPQQAKKNTMKIIHVLLSIVIATFATSCFCQNKVQTGIKANFGPYIPENEDNNVSEGTYFSVGFFGDYTIDSFQKWSLGTEFLYNSSSYDLNFESGPSASFNIKNVLIPLKAKYRHQKFIFSGGLINTIVFTASLQNEDYIYTDGDHIFLNGVTVKNSYIQRKYDLQGMLGIGYKVSNQVDLGLDVSFYFDKNKFTYNFNSSVEANSPSMSVAASYHFTQN